MFIAILYGFTIIGLIFSFFKSREKTKKAGSLSTGVGGEK